VAFGRQGHGAVSGPQSRPRGEIAGGIWGRHPLVEELAPGDAGPHQRAIFRGGYGMGSGGLAPLVPASEAQPLHTALPSPEHDEQEGRARPPLLGLQ
jgi:hypothetical protein